MADQKNEAKAPRNINAAFIIADDVTGACDAAAAAIAAAGGKMTIDVGLSPSCPISTAWGVVDTEARASRNGGDAANASSMCAAHTHASSANILYKKVDSTFRGWIGDELLADVKALGAGVTLLCPAFPSAGRIVVGGFLLVHGVPVAHAVTSTHGQGLAHRDTSDLRHLVLPTTTTLPAPSVQHISVDVVASGPDATFSALARIVAAHAASSAPSSSSSGSPLVVIADATANAHIDTLALAGLKLMKEKADQRLLFAGSAALLGALSRHAHASPDVPEAAAASTAAVSAAGPSNSRGGVVLVSLGTTNPRTAAQLEALVAAATAGSTLVAVVEPSEAAARGSALADVVRQSLASSSTSASSSLASSSPKSAVLVVRPPGGNTTGTVDEATLEDLASASAKAGAALRSAGVLNGLILSGGATAFHVLRASGASSLTTDGEVEAGVAVSRVQGGTFDGVGCVTKAGGLGSESAFIHCVRRFVGDDVGGKDDEALAFARRLKASMATVTPEVVTRRPIVAITLGDPSGVGAEVAVKALALDWSYAVSRPVVVGHPAVVARAIQACISAGTLPGGVAPAIREVSSPEAGLFRHGTIDVWSPEPADDDEIAANLGRVCVESGRVSVEWVKAAARAALDGRVHAVVTGPLNKEAFNKAGFKFAGHTELLAAETGVATSRLALVHIDPSSILRGEWDAAATLGVVSPSLSSSSSSSSQSHNNSTAATATAVPTQSASPSPVRGLNVVHATAHIALRDVSKALTRQRLLDTISMAFAYCVESGIAKPRIAVAGLNPHASDGGLFGDEEEKVISPTIEEANKNGLGQVSGPWPPDTVFLHASKGRFDCVVAPYHDCGHIPVKLGGFSSSVNVTLGLPIVRTSVDHGTAFDIAGKGIADHANMVGAIAKAVELGRGRVASK